MLRCLRLVGFCLALAACPTYDRYGQVTEEDGLLEADRFARLGAEQAQAVAIGRAFAAAYTGETPEARSRQIDQAARYARGLPGVRTASADTMALMITVTFRSGWQKAVIPIEDGVPADRTPGLPARR